MNKKGGRCERDKERENSCLDVRKSEYVKKVKSCVGEGEIDRKDVCRYVKERQNKDIRKSWGNFFHSINRDDSVKKIELLLFKVFPVEYKFSALL